MQRAEALDRKNYQHFDSHKDGEPAMALYTLVGACKLNAIHLWAYLSHVLGHIFHHPAIEIEELLPWAVADQLWQPS